MGELFHELSNWVLGFADSPWAVAFLAFVSYIEAIFFPIPPDPLLLAIALLQPENAIWLGIMVTVFSVLGAITSYFLGKRFGQPLVSRFFPPDKIVMVDKYYKKYGMWTTVIVAFTPLPDKVFNPIAGVLGLDFKIFTIGLIIGRAARFVTVGVLVYFLGERIEEFITNNFEKLTVVAAGLFVAVVIAWLIVRRRKGTAPAA